MDVVVVTVIGGNVQTFGDVGGVVGDVLVGRKQLAAVDGVFAVGIEVAVRYVGNLVTGVVQTVFGQFDVACFNAVLGQCDIVAYFHTVVVNGGITGFDAVYHQVFVQLNGDGVALGFSRDVVVAGNGHGRTEFFDIGAAAVAVEGQAFGVNGGFGVHAFLNIIFSTLSEIDTVISCYCTIGCSCSIGGQIQSIGNLYRCFICADSISGFFA